MGAQISTEHNEEWIPTTKLVQNVAKIKPEDENKRFLLLVATGAICPIHRGHLQILENAKEYLEASGNNKVLAGYISPSHAYYVDNKMQRGGTTSIPGAERVALTRVATADSDWICESGWEAGQRDFTDYPVVASQILQHCRKKNFPLSSDCNFQLKLDLAFVCGSDLALRHRLYTGSDAYFPFDVIAVARQGADGELANLKQVINAGRAGRGFHFCEKAVVEISSTALRQRLLAGEDATDLTFPSVLEYMKANNLIIKPYEYPQHEEDEDEDEELEDAEEDDDDEKADDAEEEEKEDDEEEEDDDDELDWGIKEL